MNKLIGYCLQHRRGRRATELPFFPPALTEIFPSRLDILQEPVCRDFFAETLFLRGAVAAVAQGGMRVLEKPHFLFDQLADHLSDLLAFLPREALQPPLEPRIEVDGQAQLSAFSVKFSSHAFGKVIFSFHRLVPLVLLDFVTCTFPC